ncbi:MAG: radical SAM protein, partial [Desulfobulbaceae bacterium]|nr:radical SAM protein [Desulfobulbaceae bacterium]
FNLFDAPMPAFELLDIEKYNRLTVQTSRGCSHRCEFCASSILLTRQYKKKPKTKVLAEIDRILSIWDHPFIEFADDNTFVSKEYWKELLPELAKRKFRWFTETDISVAQDSELLQLMRKSGCAQVLIGFESPSQQPLRGMEMKQNWKANHWHGYKEAINTIQSHGISVNGCFILGLDDQDPDIFDRVFEFVDDAALHEVQVTLQTPFPGTPLYNRLIDENRILTPSAWEKCTLFDINFEPKNMSMEELANGFKNLVHQLYSEDFTQVRKQRFREILRKEVATRRSKAVEAVH